MKKITFFTLCLALFLVGNLYSQQTVWVKAGGTGDGSSEANAYGSFTTAFVQINSAGDILRVVGNVPASGQSLNKNFAYTIEGDAGGSTLTGTAGAVRMFTNNTASTTASQNVTFKNIKFTGATGSTGTGGGGVLYSNQANIINFENCRFELNSLVSTVTTGGGALFITATTVTITDCLFKENTALSKGGAIGIAAGANVTLTRCTFYKNSTTSITGNLNAAAFYVVGTAAIVNAYNCTFFQNTTGSTNQDYGVIRTDGGTTKVYNSLFYDNKLNTNVAAAGDWGSVASINSTLTNSLAQYTNANVTKTSSTVSATIALASSGLTYDNTSGFVKYTDPTPGDHTPISFGNDGKDAGAWNSPNTWKGTSGTSWTDATNWSIKGVPSATKDVLVAASSNQPIIASNVSVASLTLNASTSLTVNTGFNLTVTGAVANSGTMTLENNANLIQGGTTNTNTGNVIVKRNSASIQLYDYTLWSSPVAGQNLRTFSNSTLATRFYTYDSETDLYNVVDFTNPVYFAPATGYLIRAPNDHNTTPTVWNGAFTGVPNNGNQGLSSLTPDKYYAVGNPYPSTISADSFLNGNTTGGTLYFWRKTNNATATATTSYATYTLAGGVGTGAANSGGGSSITPNGTIQVGQGFIVKTGISATALNFTNAMRTANTADQFLRTTNEKSRYWLNLTSTTGAFCQAMVAYMPEASSGVDNAIDGRYFNDSPVALTSIINAEEYTIQGRALPFATTDTVPLGFKTNAAGNYTIAIDHVDGLFSTGQTVFLKDNLLNIVVDLSAGGYSFASAIGTFNSRFEVVYQSTLAVTNPTFTASSVIAFSENGEIRINSGNTIIELVRVYDLQGRLLVEKKQINASETKLSTTATNQVLLVEITADNGSKITKKIIQ